MKKISIILFLLCTTVCGGQLLAQIYTTSSAVYKPFGGSAYSGSSIPEATNFHSTSTYIHNDQRTITLHATYAPTEIKLANGAIRTVATNITVENETVASNSTGYIPTGPMRAPGSGGIAPPDTPLELGWDVAILLLFCCLVYAVYVRRTTNKYNA